MYIGPVCVEMLAIIQKIFWLSVKFGFRLKAAFIPGIENILSDLISRMHSVDSALALQPYLVESESSIECNGHMSESSFLSLQASWKGMTYLDS